MERTNDVKHYFSKQYNMACLDQYLSLAMKVDFAKGEDIFQKYSPQHYLFYVYQGEVGRTMLTASGNEKIVKVVGERSIIGEVVFFQSLNNVNYCQARKKCEIYLFPRSVVYEVLLKDEKVVQGLINWFCSRMSSLSAQITDSMVRDTHYRVCSFLYNYACDFGKIDAQGHYVYKGKLSHYDIAKYLGINRVSVTKVLKGLQEQGIIIKERDRLAILDMAYFEQM